MASGEGGTWGYYALCVVWASWEVLAKRTGLPNNGAAGLLRGCENIHSWISLVGDLAFSHQGGIYGFKFPKWFSGDLFLRSHSFTLFLNKSILKAQPSGPMPFPLSFCICMAQCHPSSQAFSQFIRPSSRLSYTSKTDCILKYLLLDIN